MSYLFSNYFMYIFERLRRKKESTRYASHQQRHSLSSTSTLPCKIDWSSTASHQFPSSMHSVISPPYHVMQREGRFFSPSFLSLAPLWVSSSVPESSVLARLFWEINYLTKGGGKEGRQTDVVKIGHWKTHSRGWKEKTGDTWLGQWPACRWRSLWSFDGVLSSWDVGDANE